MARRPHETFFSSCGSFSKLFRCPGFSANDFRRTTSLHLMRSSHLSPLVAVLYIRNIISIVFNPILYVLQMLIFSTVPSVDFENADHDRERGDWPNNSRCNFSDDCLKWLLHENTPTWYRFILHTSLTPEVKINFNTFLTNLRTCSSIRLQFTWQEYQRDRQFYDAKYSCGGFNYSNWRSMWWYRPDEKPSSLILFSKLHHIGNSQGWQQVTLGNLGSLSLQSLEAITSSSLSSD